MLDPQSLPITPCRRIIVNRIPIIRIRPIRIARRKLPKTIARYARLTQYRALPHRHPLLPRAHTRRRILLQHDRFPRRFADRVMLTDPCAAPAVVVPPLIGVEVESTVVDGGDGEVLDEIDAFVPAVGVGAVASCYGGGQPAFVAERDHVVGVEGFDEFAGGACPVRDD